MTYKDGAGRPLRLDPGSRFSLDDMSVDYPAYLGGDEPWEDYFTVKGLTVRLKQLGAMARGSVVDDGTRRTLYQEVTGLSDWDCVQQAIDLASLCDDGSIGAELGNRNKMVPMTQYLPAGWITPEHASGLLANEGVLTADFEKRMSSAVRLLANALAKSMKGIEATYESDVSYPSKSIYGVYPPCGSRDPLNDVALAVHMKISGDLDGPIRKRLGSLSLTDPFTHDFSLKCRRLKDQAFDDVSRYVKVVSYPQLLGRTQEVRQGKDVYGALVSTDGKELGLMKCDSGVSRRRWIRAHPAFVNLGYLEYAAKLKTVMTNLKGMKSGHWADAGVLGQLYYDACADPGTAATDRSKFDDSMNAYLCHCAVSAWFLSGVVPEYLCTSFLADLESEILTQFDRVDGKPGPFRLLKRKGGLDSGHLLTSLLGSTINMLSVLCACEKVGSKPSFLFTYGEPDLGDFLCMIKGDDMLMVGDSQLVADVENAIIDDDGPSGLTTTKEDEAIFLQTVYDFSRPFVISEADIGAGSYVGQKCGWHTGIASRRLNKLFNPERSRTHIVPYVLACATHLEDLKMHPRVKVFSMIVEEFLTELDERLTGADVMQVVKADWFRKETDSYVRSVEGVSWYRDVSWETGVPDTQMSIISEMDLSSSPKLSKSRLDFLRQVAFEVFPPDLNWLSLGREFVNS